VHRALTRAVATAGINAEVLEAVNVSLPAGKLLVPDAVVVAAIAIDDSATLKHVGRAGRRGDQNNTMTGPWDCQVSNTGSAKALWPTLKAKIDRCRDGAALAS
jgi:hypothetical protein